MSLDDDILEHLHYDRFSYERLLLQQPHIDFDGLWYDPHSKRAFILCQTLNQGVKTESGKDINSWFKQECKAASSGVQLVDKIDEEFIRIPDRTSAEIASLHSFPIRAVEFPYYVDMFLPKDFPKVFVREDKPPLTKCTSVRELTEDEKTIVKNISRNITGLMKYEFLTDKDDPIPIPENPKKHTRDPMALTHSRTLKRVAPLMPKKLLSKIEEDDDFWASNQKSIFESFECSMALPTEFASKNSACLVDASCWPTKNIRTYLSLFQRVIINLPIEEYMESFFSSVGVTRQELFKLAELGRVQFLCPLPVFRYEQKLLSEIADNVPSSILFSRKLAAYTIQEIRARNPFCFPPLGTKERVLVLKSLVALEKKFSPFVDGLLREHCAKSWLHFEADVQFEGASCLSKYGMAPFLAKIFQKHQGRDLYLESVSASMPLEWAIGLNAAYFPVELSSYSDAAMATICASVYSGTFTPNSVCKFPELEMLIKNMLAINNDCDVFDMASVFNRSVTEELRGIIQDFYKQGDSELKQRIERYTYDINDKVRRYEKRSAKLERLDLLSLLGAIVAVIEPSYTWVPLGTWLASYCLEKADPDQDIGGPLYSWLRSLATQSPREAIFISRLRKKMPR